MSDREADMYIDRQHLATRAYGNSGNLQARADIYSYQQPRVDLQGWVLGQVAWRGDERVLDVGCGPGSYLRRLAQDYPAMRLSAFDLSKGMLLDLEHSWTVAASVPGRAVADAQALPLLSDSQDVLLATHMLYHVPDIGKAAHEFRRVARPGGMLLAVTNADEHTRELVDLYDHALGALGVQQDEARWSRRFSRDNGAPLLGVAFADVVRHDKDSQLIVPRIEPVMRYLHSMRATREHLLPGGTTWDDLMREAERIVAHTIAHDGAFRVRTAVSLFVCR